MCLFTMLSIAAQDVASSTILLLVVYPEAILEKNDRA
jgi:hypothetical protein